MRCVSRRETTVGVSQGEVPVKATFTLTLSEPYQLQYCSFLLDLKVWSMQPRHDYNSSSGAVMRIITVSTFFLCCVLFSNGEFPPVPENITVTSSKFDPNINLSYKKTHGICETTPGVESYSGYVHIPPDTVDNQHYPINTFFWFFEARKNARDAPLTVWLSGGPGGS